MIDDLRRDLLAAALPHVAFDGWTQGALRRAARELDLPAAEAERAFPGGAREMLTFFIAETDRRMLADLAAHDLAAMKVRERITLAVRLRLGALAPHREAVRQGLSLLALPHNAGLGTRTLYHTVDAIWYAAGDTSTDYNFYTKRGLLAGVYGATVLYWLDDSSEDFAETWAFLDRRIADVMAIPKAKARVQKSLGMLPNPLRVLRPLTRQMRDRRRPIRAL